MVIKDIKDLLSAYEELQGLHQQLDIKRRKYGKRNPERFETMRPFLDEIMRINKAIEEYRKSRR